MCMHKGMKNIHILMFHNVAPAGSLNDLLPYVVTPEAFAHQLDMIQACGFETISFDELFKGGGVGFKKRKIIISFDDCPTNLLEFALPELHKRGMKATFFAPAGKLGESNHWDADRGMTKVPLMQADDLRSLVKSGHEVGSHGFNHINLSELPEQEVCDELIRSRETLEHITGRPVNFLAYPFGDIPANYQRLCSEAGYIGACSIFSRYQYVFSEPFAMRRILIHEADTGLRLRFKLSSLYLRLRPFVDRRVLAR